MFIDKNSVVINGISMGQYCVEASFGYNKLWASGSGRNLAGKNTGTLLGIYPKIILQFGRLTREQLNVISPILNSANQTVTYFDPDLNRQVTLDTYTGDWELKNKKIGKAEGFSCSFISNDKRR